MLKKGLFIHLPVMAIICGGCYSNRALIAPSRFAPKNPETVWHAPAIAHQPAFPGPAVLPTQNIPLTLAELVDIALQNNAQTQETWAEARLAAAQYAQAQSGDWPALSGTVNYQHQRNASVSTPGGTVSTGIASTPTGGVVLGTSANGTATTQVVPFFYTQWGPQLALTYTILDFGQQRATTEAARQALYYANWTFNRSLQTLIQTITTDYYSYLYQKQLLYSYVADIETSQVTLDAAVVGLKSGVKDMSDVLQARTNLLSKKMQWAGQRQEVQNSFATLLSDMGLSASESFPVEDLPDTPPSLETLEDVEKLISQALQLRPDLLAARADVLSKKESLLAARKQYFPTLDYEFDFGKTYYPGSLNDGYDFLSSVTLNVPIFSGFYYRNGVKIAEANKEQSEATLKDVELTVIKDVYTAHYNVKIAYDTLNYANAFLKSAREQYDMAISQYRAGVNTITDVISAQSALADARASQASSLQQWFTSLANLVYATGTLYKPINPEESP